MGFLKFEITTRKNVPLDSAYKINPNATDYTALRQFMQGVFSVLNQSLGGGATDTGVHFVKDKCVIACPVGQNNPQCQH